MAGNFASPPACFFGVDVIWIFQSLFFFVFSREMGASLHATQKGGASISFVAKNKRFRNWETSGAFPPQRATYFSTICIM